MLISWYKLSHKEKRGLLLCPWGQEKKRKQKVSRNDRPSAKIAEFKSSVPAELPSR